MAPERTRRRNRSGDAGELADVAGAIAQLGAEAAHVAIWRLLPGSSSPPKYLGRIPAVDFTLDLVAERWGGGDFRARVANQANVWVKDGTFTFAIDGKPKTPDAAAAESNGAGAHANGNSASLGEKLLLATVPALVAAFGGAIAKMLTERKEPDPILLELLKQRAGGKEIGPIELMNLVETMRRNTRDETLEMMGDREPTKAIPTSWADVVMNTVPELVQVFKREQNDRDRPPRARASVTADTAGGETVTQPTQPAWLVRARKHLAFSLMLADKGKDPVIQAATMIDMLDEPDVQELAASTSSETFIDDVLTAIPEFASTPARRDWFTKFLTAVKESFEDEEGGGVAAPAPLTPAAAAKATADG